MLESLIDYYSKGNKAKFATKIGISPQALSMWITRKSFDAELLYTKCEHISAQWLLSGEGDMIQKKESETDINNEDKAFYQEQIKNLMQQIHVLTDKNSQLENILLDFLKKDFQSTENPKRENVG